VGSSSRSRTRHELEPAWLEPQ
jgi:hypothetical protein